MNVLMHTRVVWCRTARRNGDHVLPRHGLSTKTQLARGLGSGFRDGLNDFVEVLVHAFGRSGHRDRRHDSVEWPANGAGDGQDTQLRFTAVLGVAASSHLAELLS